MCVLKPKPYFTYYKMGWVYGYTLQQVMGNPHYYATTYTPPEKRPPGFIRDLDEKYLLFTTKEAAIAAATKERSEAKSRHEKQFPDLAFKAKYFVRLMLYGTPTIENAREQCVIKEDGEPVAIEGASCWDSTTFVESF